VVGPVRAPDDARAGGRLEHLLADGVERVPRDEDLARQREAHHAPGRVDGEAEQLLAVLGAGHVDALAHVDADPRLHGQVGEFGLERERALQRGGRHRKRREEPVAGIVLLSPAVPGDAGPEALVVLGDDPRSLDIAQLALEIRRPDDVVNKNACRLVRAVVSVSVMSRVGAGW